MAKKIFLGGLSVTTSESTINTYFSPYGAIVETYIDRDPAGGSNGWGTVEYTTSAEGDAAEAAMNGAVIDGATIAVRPV